jgi:uncharacterized protein YukE
VAQVHVDPEVLREFAQHLEAYANETREGTQRLVQMLHDMGSSTWQDGQYRAFSEAFEELSQTLLRAMEALDTEQVPRLRFLADKAQEVLDS